MVHMILYLVVHSCIYYFIFICTEVITWFYINCIVVVYTTLYLVVHRLYTLFIFTCTVVPVPVRLVCGSANISQMCVYKYI